MREGRKKKKKGMDVEPWAKQRKKNERGERGRARATQASKTADTHTSRHGGGRKGDAAPWGFRGGGGEGEGGRVVLLRAENKPRQKGARARLPSFVAPQSLGSAPGQHELARKSPLLFCPAPRDRARGERAFLGGVFFSAPPPPRQRTGGCVKKDGAHALCFWVFRSIGSSARRGSAPFGSFCSGVPTRRAGGRRGMACGRVGPPPPRPPRRLREGGKGGRRGVGRSRRLLSLGCRVLVCVLLLLRVVFSRWKGDRRSLSLSRFLAVCVRSLSLSHALSRFLSVCVLAPLATWKKETGAPKEGRRRRRSMAS